MSNTKTEAQRLADALQRDMDMNWPDFDNGEAIVNELRSLDAQNKAMHKIIDQLRAQLAKAVADEREACAKVCEYQADRFMQASPLEGNRPYASHECAAAIRARSNT